MDFKRDLLTALSLALSMISICAGEDTGRTPQAAEGKKLEQARTSKMSPGTLPNGEPVIGAYYYQFRGAPYIHAAWTPEREYDNYGKSSHIYALLKSAADWGVNCIAFCCDSTPRLVEGGGAERARPSENLLEALRRTYEQNRKLFAVGKKLFISPFFHVAPEQSEAEAPDPNAAEQRGRRARIASLFGKEPSFVMLIDGDATGGAPSSSHAARQDTGKPGNTPSIRFHTGVTYPPRGVRQPGAETPASPNGLLSRRTAFDRLINQPFVTAKIASEIAKFSDGSFFYEVSPSFSDSQRRDGVRIEGDPYLYPYGWAHALSTLADGVMISSLNDWPNGTAIDASKEYGRRRYETTERYSSVFKSVFPSLRAEKRRKKSIAVIHASRLEEGALYPPAEADKAQTDALGIIKALECLSLSFDVIPEESLTEDELAGRRLIFEPSCCSPNSHEMLHDWVSKWGDKALIVSVCDRSEQSDRWWIDKLGLEIGDKPVDIKSYAFAQANLTDRSENLNITDWPQCEALAKDDNGVPKILRKKFTLGPRRSQIILINGRLGDEFYQSFYEAAANGRIPNEMCDAAATLVDFSLGETATLLRHMMPASSSYEIARGPVLRAENTLITPAVNVIPWAYIAEHHRIEMSRFAEGGRLESASEVDRSSVENRGHFAENTKPWYREPVKFNVPVPANEIVSEVCVIDSDDMAAAIDPQRFYDISFTIVNPNEVNAGNEAASRLRKLTYKGVEFAHPLKFYALFAIALSPVKFDMDELTIHRGETRTVECTLANLSDGPISGVVRLKSVGATSDLTMDEVKFSLGTEKSTNPPALGETGKRATKAALTFRAAPDCATGNRTVIFEIEAPPGKKALFWRRVRCERDPILKCRTTRIGGFAGQIAQVEVVLANVGGEEIKEAELKLIGQSGLSAYEDSTEPRATLVDLAPGHSRAATFKINLPRPRRPKSKTTPNPFYETADVKLSVQYQVFGEDRKEEFPLKLISVVPTNRIRRPKWLSRSATPVYVVNPYEFKRVHPFPVTLSLTMLPTERLGEAVPVILDGKGDPVALQIRGKEITFVAPILDQMSVFWVQAPKRGAKDAAEAVKSSRGLTVREVTGEGTRSIHVENDKIALEWDGRKRGALIGFRSKGTGTDYLQFSRSGRAAPRESQQGRTSEAPATGADQSKARSELTRKGDERVTDERDSWASFTFQYTKADGETVTSSAAAPNVTSELALFEQGRNRVAVLSWFKNDDLEVRDHWSVHSGSPFVRLLREIKPKKDLKLKDFVPLNVRFIARPFDMILPNGVGFTRSDGSKGGYIETSHVADGYYAYSGDHAKAGDAAGIMILKAGLSLHSSDDKEMMALYANASDVLRKVRYGFFTTSGKAGAGNPVERECLNEFRIGIRGKTQLEARETMVMEILAFAGSGLPYDYVREQAVLERHPPLVLIGDDAKEIGGLQTPTGLADH